MGIHMKIHSGFVASAVVTAGALFLSGCGGSDGTDTAVASAEPLDVAAIPDALFAAGIECRNPDVREYSIWNIPYRKLVCFGGGDSGGGDWAVNVMVFGSSDVFYGALNEYCDGKETTSSGSFLPLDRVTLGSNWMAGVETTSASDLTQIPTPEEFAAALGGTAAASADETCTFARDRLAESAATS